MATTTLTPTPTSATTETPKLIKKATSSDLRSPTTPTQTSFGCPHIKGLLQAAREKATDEYTRLMRSVRKDGNVSSRTHKSGDKTNATGDSTFMCLQCSTVSRMMERHSKQHAFSVESDNGFIYCHECKDYVYDPTFEEIRSGNSKKRKASATHWDSDSKRLVSGNSTATPCAATGLRGLYNMGQTCFMSVILQSIIHNPFIRTYYLAEGHRASECEREACTSCALDDIFTDFFGQEKHEGYGAVHMLQGCWKGGGGLAGYSQQDAHEYLGFILNSLHSANTAEDEENNASQKDSAKDCDCAVHQTFGGLLRSTVTCSKCKNTTSTLDPFMDLSLDIRNSGNITIKKKKLALINGTQTVKEILPMALSECLEQFTKPETLSSDSYHCRNCSSSQEAEKKLSLSRLPPVIPIHLKRFSHSKTSAQSSKVETKIRFPFSLDLTPYTTSSSSKSKKERPPIANGAARRTGEPVGSADDTDSTSQATNIKPVYELSSVVVHKGKIDNGHYILYSRQGDKWYRFDDSMVVQVEEKEVQGAEAYMLFYVARELEG